VKSNDRRPPFKQYGPGTRPASSRFPPWADTNPLDPGSDRRRDGHRTVRAAFPDKPTRLFLVPVVRRRRVQQVPPFDLREQYDTQDRIRAKGPTSSRIVTDAEITPSRLARQGPELRA